VIEEVEAIRFPDERFTSLASLVDAAPAGAVVELAPGKYSGALTITRPITIRGAGDLSRLSGEGRGPVVTIRVPFEGRVAIESLLLDDGEGESGGGIVIEAGRVRVYNIQIRRCRSEKGAGGAIAVVGGELDASLVRAHDVSADRGGAIVVSGRGFMRLSESEIRRSEARVGGAIAIEDAARVSIEALTIGKARARTSSGGQAIYVKGSKNARPVLALRRVRLEDAPMGMPLVVDTTYPGEVTIAASDMPRVVMSANGVIDGGGNRWR
jgi:nitrous oxidase accessory protein NosD